MLPPPLREAPPTRAGSGLAGCTRTARGVTAMAWWGRGHAFAARHLPTAAGRTRPRAASTDLDDGHPWLQPEPRAGANGRRRSVANQRRRPRQMTWWRVHHLAASPAPPGSSVRRSQGSTAWRVGRRRTLPGIREADANRDRSEPLATSTAQEELAGRHRRTGPQKPGGSGVSGLQAAGDRGREAWWRPLSSCARHPVLEGSGPRQRLPTHPVTAPPSPHGSRHAFHPAGARSTSPSRRVRSETARGEARSPPLAVAGVEFFQCASRGARSVSQRAHGTPPRAPPCKLRSTDVAPPLATRPSRMPPYASDPPPRVVGGLDLQARLGRRGVRRPRRLVGDDHRRLGRRRRVAAHGQRRPGMCTPRGYTAPAPQPPATRACCPAAPPTRTWRRRRRTRAGAWRPMP